MNRVTENGCLAGRSPITVVAACIYFASKLSDDPKHAKEIAETAQCSESTLRNAYRMLYELRTELGEGLKMAKGIEDL